MIVRCRKCKSSDIEAAYPTKRSEELLALVFPLAPYQCDKCSARFLSWSSPIMDRNRTIAAGVVVGVFSLALIFTALSNPDPVMTAMQKSTPSSTPAPAGPAPSSQEAKSETSGAATPDQARVTEKPAVEKAATDAAPPAESAKPEPLDFAQAPAEVGGNGRVSQRVLEQRGNNQVKERAALEQGITPKESPAVAKTETIKTAPAPATVDKPATQAAAKQAPSPKPASEKAAVTKPEKTTAEKAALEKPAAKGAGRLEEIRIEPDGTLFKVHLIGSGTMVPKIMMGKEKCIVDLMGNWSKSRQVTDTAVDHPLVRKIRFGAHPDHLRIVFDLKVASVKASHQADVKGLLLQLAP